MKHDPNIEYFLIVLSSLSHNIIRYPLKYTCTITKILLQFINSKEVVYLIESTKWTNTKPHFTFNAPIQLSI